MLKNRLLCSGGGEQAPASSGFWLRVEFESSSSKSPSSESSSNSSGWQCILDVISSVMSPSFCPIGQDCKTLQAFLYNNVLYIRSDRKGKFWVKNSWWFKLSSQYFTERTSVIECCSYYSLLTYSVRVVFGPSRVQVGHKIPSLSRVASTRWVGRGAVSWRVTTR